MSLRAIDVGAAARAAAEDQALASARAGVDLRFVAESEEPLLTRGDDILLAELVGNLIDNAVRYNHRGGTATVRVGTVAGRIVVEVEDDGPGIPESERERVFTRFYRLDRDQGRPGSGLGLPIVRVLAHLMGAQVSLASAVDGKGLRVTVIFQPLSFPVV